MTWSANSNIFFSFRSVFWVDFSPYYRLYFPTFFAYLVIFGEYQTLWVLPFTVLDIFYISINLLEHFFSNGMQLITWKQFDPFRSFFKISPESSTRNLVNYQVLRSGWWEPAQFPALCVSFPRCGLLPHTRNADQYSAEWLQRYLRILRDHSLFGSPHSHTLSWGF